MYDIQKISRVISSIEAERGTNPYFDRMVSLAEKDCEFVVNPKFLRYFPKERIFNSSYIREKVFQKDEVYFIVDDEIDTTLLPDGYFIFSIGFNPSSPINYKFRSIILDNLAEEDKQLALWVLFS